MNELLARFDDKAKETVNTAIKDAESKTLAEILPVVARSSGSYDRAEDLIGLWSGCGLVGVAWYFFQGIRLDAGWEGQPALILGFWTLLCIFLVGFVAGVIASDRLPRLRRLFVPSKMMKMQVVTRAKTIFFDKRLHRTTGGTGVLLFVSLLEHQVVVLADDAVADQLSERALTEVCEEILEGIKENDLAGGLCNAAERVGNLLGGVLPADGDRVDEVPSEVVMLD